MARLVGWTGGSRRPTIRRGCRSVLAVFAWLGCGDAPSTGAAEPSPEEEPPAKENTEMKFPAIDPASIRELEVVHRGPISGPGYPRARVKFGPPIYTGRGLSFSPSGYGFMGEDHVWVDQKKPARHLLIDVRDGRVVVELARIEDREWQFGLTLGFEPGAETPVLVDVATGVPVSAVPEGEHEYVYGENYTVWLSHATPRAWVIARDADDVVYLEGWEDRTTPPPMPRNPFPWWPRDMWPLDQFSRQDVDIAWAPHERRTDDCPRIYLLTSTAWLCVPESAWGEQYREDMPGGWWVSESKQLFYSDRTGEGWDASRLCPAGQRMSGNVVPDVPPRYIFNCWGSGNASGPQMLWEPPNIVYRATPEIDAFLEGRATTWRFGSPGAFVSFPREDEPRDPPSHFVTFNPTAGQFELVRSDRPPCSERSARGNVVFVIECIRGFKGAHRYELVDRHRRRFGTFGAQDVAVSRNGAVVAVRRRQERDELVVLTLAE